ncbi:hypothetical protein [Streptomyces massasporeus]|uniref:hypothetical protein n=1 Tax=Streptomyces massasporeus TaxID=67324 RepID=UPI00380B4BA4
MTLSSSRPTKARLNRCASHAEAIGGSKHVDVGSEQRNPANKLLLGAPDQAVVVLAGEAFASLEPDHRAETVNAPQEFAVLRQSGAATDEVGGSGPECGPEGQDQVLALDSTIESRASCS